MFLIKYKDPFCIVVDLLAGDARCEVSLSQQHQFGHGSVELVLSQWSENLDAALAAFR